MAVRRSKKRRKPVVKRKPAKCLTRAQKKRAKGKQRKLPVCKPVHKKPKKPTTGPATPVGSVPATPLAPITGAPPPTTQPSTPVTPPPAPPSDVPAPPLQVGAPAGYA